MPKYIFKSIKTPYWKPGDDYLEIIVRSLENIIQENDFIVISEKAISVATGNIIDERKTSPGLLAYLIAKYWMKIVWGFFLGRVSNLGNETIQHLREYPISQGAIHKQIALRTMGFLRALMHGSEGGIDGSNLPYSYVSLPLRNPDCIAKRIQNHILSQLEKEVTIIIADTDKTYSIGGFHFTHRVNPITGIHSFGGFFAFVIGRFMKFKRGATPIGFFPSTLSLDVALELANVANNVRGVGAGKNVWEMAEKFNVSITEVTLEMLKSIIHRPIVVIRFRD